MDLSKKQIINQIGPLAASRRHADIDFLAQKTVHHVRPAGDIYYQLCVRTLGMESRDHVVKQIADHVADEPYAYWTANDSVRISEIFGDTPNQRFQFGAGVGERTSLVRQFETARTAFTQ